MAQTRGQQPVLLTPQKPNNNPQFNQSIARNHRESRGGIFDNPGYYIGSKAANFWPVRAKTDLVDVVKLSSDFHKPIRLGLLEIKPCLNSRANYFWAEGTIYVKVF